MQELPITEPGWTTSYARSGPRKLRCTDSVSQLATKGLLPWIKFSDILPSIQGSDHCPVYADFHESITLEDGRVLSLWEEINPPSRSRDDLPPQPPKFAAKNYDEFSGKQRLMSSFFTKKSSEGAAASGRYASGSPSLTPAPETAPSSSKVKPDPTPTPEEEPGELGVGTALKALRKLPEGGDTPASGDEGSEREASTAPTASTSQPARKASQATSESSDKGKGKAKSSTSKKANGKEEAKPKGGQPTIQGFFKPPPKPAKANGKEAKSGKKKAKSKERSASPKNEPIVVVDDEDENQPTPSSSIATGSQSTAAPASQDDWMDELLASATTAEYNAEASAKWSALMAPKATPRCVSATSVPKAARC